MADGTWRVVAEVASLPRKGKAGGPEQLRVTVSELDGSDPPRRTLSLRHWWQTADGEWAPSKQGVTIRPGEAHHLIEAARLLSEGGTPPSGAAARAEAPKAAPRSTDDRRNGFDSKRGRKMTSQRTSPCVECGAQIEAGDVIIYDGLAKRAAHLECTEGTGGRDPIGEAAHRVGGGGTHRERKVDLYANDDDVSQGGLF